ncbi:MAG: FlgO family outer membrane protein [Desulfobacterales bacterium]|nr:FlgO family outer membrane protein [Desulfobacterales bacterium]
MKRLIALLLILVFSSFMPCKAGADFKKTKIAVLDFRLQGHGYETEDMGTIVAEWFITAFVQEGRFEVVERGLLNKILGEQQLSMTGVVDETTATKIGKLLGVKAIISGSVMKLENIWEINARIIDVESASIIAAENVKSSQSTKLQDLVVQMSEKIIKNFPLEGYIVNRTDRSVTIDLGKRAGVKPGMKFIVYQEGKLIKHPKTGEILDVERIHTGRLMINSVRNKTSVADILYEEAPGSIAYGQMVHSIVAQIKTEKSQYVATTSEKQTTKPVKSRSPGIAELINMLKSDDLKNKTAAAKEIAKSYSKSPELLELVNEELLKGYSKKSKDKYFADAMAWLCNVLGGSGDKKYILTLEKVAKEAPNRKLKKYAIKNLRRLK